MSEIKFLGYLRFLFFVAEIYFGETIEMKVSVFLSVYFVLQRIRLSSKFWSMYYLSCDFVRLCNSSFSLKPL